MTKANRNRRRSICCVPKNSTLTYVSWTPVFTMTHGVIGDHYQYLPWHMVSLVSLATMVSLVTIVGVPLNLSFSSWEVNEPAAGDHAWAADERGSAAHPPIVHIGTDFLRWKLFQCSTLTICNITSPQDKNKTENTQRITFLTHDHGKDVLMHVIKFRISCIG